MAHRLTIQTIDDEAALRALLGDPTPIVVSKVSDRLNRAEFWNPARFVDRSELPSNGEIHRELKGESFDAAAYDAERAERYARREGFY